MIVFPAIDLRGGRVVRLVRGRREAETRYADDPVAVAKTFASDGATWVHVVDLDAAFGEGDNGAAVRAVAAEAGLRVQAGGGVRTPEAVDGLVGAGVARVLLGTEAIRDPAFLATAVERHGDRVAVALDVDGDQVRIRGWTDGAGTIDGVLDPLIEAGAPRFVVTQVARDGTLEGPDLALYEGLMSRLEQPVIASGGVRHASDVRALADLGVEGVVVGTALYEGGVTLAEALEAAA